MRKLYNHNKGKIHPSPTTTSDHLSFLPLALATLAASLSPQDKEVLAYILSCNTKTSGGCVPNRETHPPKFSCYCFSCYTSYWARWDRSPNRERIHEIIDRYEDGFSLISCKKNSGKYKNRKRNKALPTSSSTHAPDVENVSHAPQQDEVTRVNNNNNCDDDDDDGGGGGGGGGGGLGMSSGEKGSIRKFVSFIGERIWGVWGI